MKITQEVIAATYLAAKNANSGMLSQAEAVDTVVKAYMMEKSTITGYIRNFNHMINGERYRRTLNLSATEFFIENIFKDYGYIKLQNALSSLNQHIIYYESIINVNRKAFRDLLIKYGKITNPNVQNYPDEMDNTYQVLTEGTLQKVFVNRFERNRKARQQCINHYKPICTVCNFDFFKTYGEIGLNFIHVHHLVEISTIAEKYVINPINDLRPVCPNCHAMLHQRQPAYSIDELKNKIKH